MLTKHHVVTLLTCCLLTGIGRCLAQRSDYESAGMVYQDNYVRVELQYKLNPCSQSRTSKFRYIIIGESRGYDLFLNWRMEYYNCDNGLTRQMNHVNIGKFEGGDAGNPIPLESMDWNFAGYKLYKPYIYAGTSSTPLREASVRMPLPISIKANSVEGVRDIDYGDQTTLKEEGGSLGENAVWRWYSGSCGGTVVGEGESITVSPSASTDYYVRAEGSKGITACVHAFVNVNTESRRADYIKGRSVLCRDNNTETLEVVGGKLGKAAAWVWYKDSCGGQRIGTGTSLTITPTVNGRYWVRAEGADNITEGRSLNVTLIDQHSSPAESINGVLTTCEGSPIELSVGGGSLAPGGKWHWYGGETGTAYVLGEGPKLQYTPSSNMAIRVRGEDACGSTAERIVHMTVHQTSLAPTRIGTSKTYAYRGQKVTMSVLGGRLSDNAQWVWYKGRPGKGRRIGRGESIRRRIHKTTVYSVRAEGGCGNTATAQTSIYMERRYWFINGGVVGNPFGSGSLTSNVNNAWQSQSFGFTVGKVKTSGWYLRGKYTFHFQKPSYSMSEGSITDWNTTYANWYQNGQTSSQRISVTAGALCNINPTFLLSIGGGYGKRTLSVGINEYSTTGYSYMGTSWARDEENSAEGIEGELGLMIHLPVVNIMLGGNLLLPVTKTSDTQKHNTYVDAYAGIGINF